MPPADVSRKITSSSSGNGRSPRNPACTGLVLLSRTLTGGTERILAIRLATTAGFVRIFSIYAPTFGASEEIKDHFYDELDSLIGKTPKVEPLILLGYFNARVGSDHQSWPSCIGHHGTGRMIDNGQCVLELCSFHGLCITNTFVQSMPQQKVSWKHPRSHKWHQLDLVIARRSALNNVLATRSYHSADCDTDHAIVCSKVRLSPRKLHRSKPTGRTRINVARTADPQRREQFVASLEQTLQDLQDQDATPRWNTVSNTIYNAAITEFGKRERPNQDWFNANLHVMVPVIETKREALLAYKHNPCEKTLSALRSARSIAQRTARGCANDYWLKLCERIQNSADCGNVSGMYDGIKKAVGPTVRKMAPLKSTSG